MEILILSKRETKIIDPNTFNWTIQSEDFWRERLTPEQFAVLRMKGTERAFSGKYCETKAEGTYNCAGCDLPLFNYKTKYDSGSGWPSFCKAIDESRIMQKDEYDKYLGHRIEVVCARCESHLGHVFDDGPPPTFKRYCLNSVALKLSK